MDSRTLLIAAVSLLFTFPEDDLAYAPEEGAVVRKTFREETEWRLVSLTQTAGNFVDEMAVPDMSGLNDWEVEVQDELIEAGDGRPTALRRTFVEVSRNSALDLAMEGIEEAYDFELETPLVDETVLFRWDEDEDEWTVESDGADASALEGLSEDMDLRAFLPAEQVARGDAWTVDAALLIDVFAPGGQLGFRLDRRPEGAFEVLRPTDVASTALCALTDAADELDGRVALEWSETVEEDGERLALIELSVEATLTADVTDDLRRLLEDIGPTVKFEPELSAVWAVEGHGELVWNLTAGRFQTLVLELEGELEITMAWQAGSLAMEMWTGMECTTSLAAQAGPADGR